MLVLLGAMKEEIADLQDGMDIEETFKEQSIHIYRGKYGNQDVILAQTGIGRKQAEKTTEIILNKYPVRAIVNFGFAGALADGLNIGDVAVCSTLHSENKHGAEDLEQYGLFYSDSGLVAIAEHNHSEGRADIPQFSNVTVDSPVCQPAAKLEMGKAYSAQMVDMESYWIAKIAAASNIPFLSISVVSDTVHDKLPDFDRFLDSDNLHIGKALVHFLTHPLQLKYLFHFYRNSRRARKSLSSYMDTLIPALQSI